MARSTPKSTASHQAPARRWTVAVAPIAILVLAAIGTFAVTQGLPSSSAPAPLPSATFDVAPSAVSDPTTGPLPEIVGNATGGEDADPRSGAADPAAASSAQPGEPSGVQPADPAEPHGRLEGPDAQRLRIDLRNDHLVIPVLGVDADVRAGAIDAGELTVPSDVSAVTLWTGSAPLSAPAGSILVAGHVDNRSQGPGALHDLYLARPGDVVYLTHDSVVTRWKILGLQVVPKDQIPASLFDGPDGQRVLNLVTCGGIVTNGHYDKNVIATAAQF